MADEGEWPHHQILRVHRQYTFRQHLMLQEAVPYLARRKAIPKNLRKEIEKVPEHNDDNINFLLAYLREARVERFVRFIEAIGDSVAEVKEHVALIDTMSDNLEKISNANLDQVRRVRAVVKYVREGSKTLQTEVQRGEDSPALETRVEECFHSESTVIQKEDGNSSETTVTEDVTTGSVEPNSAPITDAKTTTDGKTPSEIEEGELHGMERLQLTSLPESKNISRSTRHPPGFVEPRFVEVFRRDSLVDSQSMWKYHDPVHGVNIDIPINAVPSNILIFAVIGHAYLGGNFEIPDEYETCTAIITLHTDPEFEFIEPVSLTLPHSVIFDGDEDLEDLIILRAQDPDITQTSSPPVYKFSDVISDADYSEDYYVHVDLKHFCAVVGAKRRRKYRQSKHFSSLSLSRQGSLNKQRRRSRRNVMKRRLKMIQKGDSVGSSRHSSYDDSFDKPSPLLRQQCSSTESDGTFPRQLHRQVAIHRDDDNFSSKSAASPLLQQTSSTDEDASCNEICIVCCSPVKCTTNWTTRFMVARNTPTGRKALCDALIAFERRSCMQMESVSQIAFPYNHYIRFDPKEWMNSDWIVNAIATPLIHLGLVYSDFNQGQPQFVDFDAESKNQRDSSPLRQKITVTGAGTKPDGEQIYFTIKSTEKHVIYSSDVLYTKSWLYPENSQLLHALSSRNDQDSNVNLNPYLKPHQSDNHNADSCKLIADIALQIPCTLCDDLLECLQLSDEERSCLKSEESRNSTECIYRALFTWILSKRRPHLGELKCVLAKLGFRDIKLCHRETQLLTNNPGLCDIECDRHLCTHLADKLGKQWRFVGRYLGLDEATIDNLLDVAVSEGKTEAVSRMFTTWRQQYSTEASVATFVRAISRVNELNSLYMSEAYWFMEQAVDEIMERK